MNIHVKDETLISFLYGECSTTEHKRVQTHVDQCETCQTLCKELNSIVTMAQKVQTPPVSENVVQSIQMYANVQFSKQKNIKKTFLGHFIPFFSHKWLYVSSLAVTIITGMVFLYPREQKNLMLDDGQFDAAITLLHDEIDEYVWEYEENQYLFLDEDITDLEMKLNTLNEEDNSLF